MKIITCALYMFQINSKYRNNIQNKNETFNLIIKTISEEKEGNDERLSFSNLEPSIEKINILNNKKKILDLLTSTQIVSINKINIINNNIHLFKEFETNYTTNIFAGNLLSNWNFEEIL